MRQGTGSLTSRTPIIDLHAHPALDLPLPVRRCDTGHDTKRNQLLMDAANHFINFERPLDPRASSRYRLQDAFDVGITFGSVLYDPADELFGPCDPFANLTAQRQAMEVELASHRYHLVRNPRQLKEAIDGGLPAAFHCVEGGFGIGEPTNVEQLANDGVAYVVLAHLIFREVSACVNALPFLTDEQFDRIFSNPTNGLTPHGVQLCERLCERGIIPDITHMTSTAACQTLEIASRHHRPVIISHGAPQGSSGTQFKLNASDDVIRGVRDSGGVIGVIFFDHWLSSTSPDPHTEGLTRVVNAIKRIRDVAGTTECIAIGSDLEGFIHPVDGLENVGQIRHLEVALKNDASFTVDHIEGILWKNAFRTLSLGWVGPM